MAWIAPTPATFKARFPKFKDVETAIVQEGLDEAARRVDDSWPTQEDFALGRMLYAAHVLTMDGHGVGAEAFMINTAGSGVKSYKAGDTAIEFAGAGTVGGANATGSTLAMTTFGVRFKELRNRFFGGPLVIGGGLPGLSGAATDWPI